MPDTETCFLTATEWQSLTNRAAGLFQGQTGNVKAAAEKRVSVRG